MIILGIDPGLAITGFCALEYEKGKFNLLTWGSIQTEKGQDVATRLLEIHKDLKVLIKDIKPDVMAIEEIFFFKNAKTIVPVLEARGVIMMTAKLYELEVYEYTPLVVKQVITGYGRAEKHEVKDMLFRLLDIKDNVKLDDVVDAAAIAYCYARSEC